MFPGIGDKTQREHNTGLYSNAYRSDEDTTCMDVSYLKKKVNDRTNKQTEEDQ
jgi:hypothetical protein